LQASSSLFYEVFRQYDSGNRLLGQAQAEVLQISLPVVNAAIESQQYLAFKDGALLQQWLPGLESAGKERRKRAQAAKWARWEEEQRQLKAQEEEAKRARLEEEKGKSGKGKEKGKGKEGV
jgi:hypothetical protein